MSRELAQRWLVQGRLVALEPLHIGGLGSEGDIDLGLARNGHGQFLVPSTSLVGAWRSAVRNAWPESVHLDNLLFGPYQFSGGADSGGASFVSVDDAVACGPVVMVARDRVGIDRKTGTAAKDVLFRQALLPAGTEFELTIEVDLPSDKLEDLQAQLRASLGVLISGLPLGSGSTHGFGLVRLKEDAKVAIINVACGGPKALGELLKPTFKLLAEELPAGHIASNEARSEIEWTATTSIVVGNGLPGDSVDAVPLADMSAETVELVIPGTSIRGALRSHAEMIVRTLKGIDAPEGPLHEQVSPDEVLTALFGGISSDGLGSEWLEKSALRVGEVRASTTLKSEVWAEVVGASKGVPTKNATGAEKHKNLTSESLEALKSAGFRIRQRVAIDRWTGGASDGALYSVLAPEGNQIKWGNIVLTVDLARLEQTGLKDRAMALFWLVLRDLHAGLISLGSRANRGHGNIQVSGRPMVQIGDNKRIAPDQTWVHAWEKWLETIVFDQREVSGQ